MLFNEVGKQLLEDLPPLVGDLVVPIMFLHQLPNLRALAKISKAEKRVFALLYCGSAERDKMYCQFLFSGRLTIL